MVHPKRRTAALLRLGGDSHIVDLVANINAGGIRMHDVQTEVFALHLPDYLPSLLAVHLVPMLLGGSLMASFLVGLRWLAFHVLLFPR